MTRLIDAGALMALVKGHGCDKCPSGALQCTFCTLNQFIVMIDSAPAIDAAPVRRGEWVTVGDDDQDEGMFFCSRCKDERWFGEEVHTSAEAARLCHYCPNCGADMRGETHGTD